MARMLVGALLLGVVLGCDPTVTTQIAGGSGGGPGGGGAPSAVSVTIGDNFYDPADDTVASGGTVTWHWTGVNQHSVTFDSGGIASATQDSGSFSHTFSGSGLLTYFCSVHGRAVMSGTIVVK